MTKHVYSDIWVYGDLRSDRFFEFSLKVLAAAVKLSLSTSGQAAMVFAAKPENAGSGPVAEAFPAVPLDQARKAAIGHGANRIYVLESKHFLETRADIHAAAMAKFAKSRKPLLVLFPSTEFNREVAAGAARRCNAGLIADCLDLNASSEGIKATCPSWGGEILADIVFSGKRRTGFATVQPHAFKKLSVPGKPGTMENIPVGPIRIPKGLRRIASAVEPAEHRKLEDAELVVVGGAGLGTADGFAMVRQLAASLGGEIGTTRPPVLQHWVDGELLIGQTGKTVRPKLLFFHRHIRCNPVYGRYPGV
jgi:electron transfer flavoprotein alpha subunit